MPLVSFPSSCKLSYPSSDNKEIKLDSSFLSNVSIIAPNYVIDHPDCRELLGLSVH